MGRYEVPDGKVPDPDDRRRYYDSEADRQVMLAAAQGDVARMNEWLQKNGNNVNCKCSQKRTPLHEAASGVLDWDSCGHFPSGQTAPPARSRRWRRS